MNARVNRDSIQGGEFAAAALRAESISAGYPGKAPVFRELSLELRRGSVLAVIGPNGSGKTTLFKALTGELPLAGGRVLIAGPAAARGPSLGAGEAVDAGAWTDIRKLSPRARALRISRVLQDERSAWAVPVADYVEAGLFAAEGWFAHDKAASARKVAASLESVGIAQLAGRPVTELSGGEFRRVVIARALVQDTGILLLDEPTADLDLAHQMDTLELLLGLADSGKAIAFSVHDLNQAAMVADRILLLAGGGVAAYGSPDEVLRPEIIEKYYGAKVYVGRHPATDLPHVVPDPGWMASRRD